MQVAATQVTTVPTPKPAAKQTSRPRLAFLRGRSWKFYAALAIGIPCVLGSIFIGYFYIQFSRVIDARMHGEFQRTDPRIFARPLTVRLLWILSTNKVMNTPSSRWVRELSGDGPGPNSAEQAVLAEVLAAIRRVRHGSVLLTLQDAKVVQIETTEKKRL